MDKMLETNIAKKYKAGRIQQKMLDGANELEGTGAEHLLAGLKVFGDRMLEVTEMLEKEIGIEVNMSIPNKNARDDRNRLDIEQPEGSVDRVQSQQTKWADRIR